MIKYFFPLWCASILTGGAVSGQSLEIMAGDKNIFADLQWLQYFDTTYHWSVFSRTRATLDYDNRADIFSGAYFNYTSGSGIGGSLVGKISSSSGGGADAGIHFFRFRPHWTLFALASIGLKSELEYSWFSIFRWTPPLGKNWRLFTGLELFSLFGRPGHLFSVQRIRLGLDYRTYQFGGAANFSEAGGRFRSNLGGFLRKSF